MLIAIQHPETKVFAQFSDVGNGLYRNWNLTGTGHIPTLFTNETDAHEARSDGGLEDSYDIVRLRVER